jgi:hypothetical protein
MAQVNLLEEILSEWFEFKGYFVKRNVRVGLLEKGGYQTELDIVAFHPETKHLVHIEPSGGATSWVKREEQYQKKFDAGRKYIPDLFRGLDIPSEIDQIAVMAYATKSNRETVGGGRILLFSELLVDIFREVCHWDIYKRVIPEKYGLLRLCQYIAAYKKEIWTTLSEEERR